MPETDTELLEKARVFRAKAKRARQLARLVPHPEASPLLEQYAAELEERARELEAGATSTC
jgi:hypothetical protein